TSPKQVVAQPIANVVDASRVVPFGGWRAGGVSSPEFNGDHTAPTVGVEILVDSATQLTFRRYGNNGWPSTPLDVDLTTFVVEWGANWTVSAASVVDSAAGGSGADS